MEMICDRSQIRSILGKDRIVRTRDKEGKLVKAAIKKPLTEPFC